MIEQITSLLFLRRLDDLQLAEDRKEARTGEKARRIFPKDKDARGRAYEDFRWSRFKDFAPAERYEVVSRHDRKGSPFDRQDEED